MYSSLGENEHVNLKIGVVNKKWWNFGIIEELFGSLLNLEIFKVEKFEWNLPNES